MSDSTSKARPQYRNVDFKQISKYRLPLAGRVSILHRISGALLFLSLPIIFLPLFAASVASPESFAALGTGFGGFLLKLILTVLVYMFMHHICAGIRYLILDLHIGLDKESSQKSAKIVFITSAVLTFVFAIKLWSVL